MLEKFGKFRLSSYDQMCKILILWLFIELQPKKYKMHFNIGNKKYTTGVYDELCYLKATCT